MLGSRLNSIPDPPLPNRVFLRTTTESDHGFHSSHIPPPPHFPTTFPSAATFNKFLPRTPNCAAPTTTFSARTELSHAHTSTPMPPFLISFLLICEVLLLTSSMPIPHPTM